MQNDAISMIMTIILAFIVTQYSFNVSNEHAMQMHTFACVCVCVHIILYSPCMLYSKLYGDIFQIYCSILISYVSKIVERGHRGGVERQEAQ